MTDAPLKIERLRKRPDFLAAARAFSCARGAVVVQARDREDHAPLVRVGFTATRKVGGAVVGVIVFAVTLNQVATRRSLASAARKAIEK